MMGEHPKLFVLDFTEVPLVDSSAAKMLERFAHRLHHAGTEIVFAGTSAGIRHMLVHAGLKRPLVRYAADAAHVLSDRDAKRRIPP